MNDMFELIKTDKGFGVYPAGVIPLIGTGMYMNLRNLKHM